MKPYMKTLRSFCLTMSAAMLSIIWFHHWYENCQKRTFSFLHSMVILIFLKLVYMHSSKLTTVLKYWVHLMNISRKKKKRLKTLNSRSKVYLFISLILKKITLRIFSETLKAKFGKGEVDFRDPLFCSLGFLLRNELVTYEWLHFISLIVRHLEVLN